MSNDALMAVSPIDGRYYSKTKELREYFSEYALIRYRVRVEIEYFIELTQNSIPQLKNFDSSKYELLRDLYRNFTAEDAEKVKNIEKTTNHDVKAVEYFIKEYFDAHGLSQFKEFIHFGLTSQDINNTATPLLLKESVENVYLPRLENTVATIAALADEWKDIPMLARTHGQPASPTRLGKEMNVFVVRLNEQIRQLKEIPFSAKFGGATGNFNAHNVAFPHIDWMAFGNKFVNEILGLHRSCPTTQIEHYDNIAALMHCMARINTIFIDFARDIWTYVSMEYFKQKIKAGEVGSSAMPHKVNPIDFENAEGNLGIANAICEHLARKLPISRLQRDLTDSTVLRNLGVPMGHILIALASLDKGMSKLLLNREKIDADLENNWMVVAEAIQTILRRENYPNPYEALKALTRTNAKVTHQTFIDFARDIWTYVSMEYFKQKIKAGEVGSSAMPHKVNPIDFENAEGNLGIANAICEHLARKLPISRLQRDLTDSTVLRNLGVPMGHILIALASLDKGMSKLLLNREKIDADLENNWMVVAEAIQTILRRENYPNPYEALKALTRTNAKVTHQTFIDFIGGLDVSEDVKAELMQITPFNYTGI